MSDRMLDLSKGVIPIVVVASLLVSAFLVGYRLGTVETVLENEKARISDVRSDISSLERADKVQEIDIQSIKLALARAGIHVEN